MPLPWKKTKVARISRLVADLQSPKRGGSLVVQTGFPTSLVDLFVKNRDRLKKQSKKKSETHPQIEISSPVTKGAPPPIYHDLTVNPSSSRPVNGITNTYVQEIVVVEEFDGGGSGCGGGVDGSNRNGILLAVLKIFLVAVLALSTKRLAVGVTLSAILLLMLEYVGARGLFCPKAKNFVESFLGKIKSGKDVSSVKKTEIREESSRNSGFELGDDTGLLNSSSMVEEDRIDDHQRKRCLNMEGGEKKMVEEVKIRDVLMTRKSEGRRGSKIREKLMKRLLPKKLRSSKKEKKKDQVESSSSHVSGFQEQEHENESSMAAVPLEEEKSREVEEKESEGKSSGYLILVFMVPLAGLVGGRILALVLTLGGCVVIKLAGKKPRPVSFSISCC